MKLLLQAGIHLIKKVITFVIYERSVQVSLKLVRFFVFSPLSFVLLTDNCFLSHRFHRSTQMFFPILYFMFGHFIILSYLCKQV